MYSGPAAISVTNKEDISLKFTRNQEKRDKECLNINETVKQSRFSNSPSSSMSNSRKMAMIKEDPLLLIRASKKKRAL